MKELTGQRFGRLVAIRPTDKRRRRYTVWECLCDCGNTVFVDIQCLTGGNTQSCGCLATKARRKNAKDVTGQRFGKLTALRPTEKRDCGSVVWECQCDCGNTALIPYRQLTSHKRIKSCGCDSRNKYPKDLTGLRFGRLVVLSATASRERKNVIWECQCDCGNTTFVRTNLLTSGNTQSCGCLRNERRRHPQDFTGQRFGAVVALRLTGESSKYGVIWECQCDCGNLTYISSDKLRRSGHAQSCGCIPKKGRY